MIVMFTMRDKLQLQSTQRSIDDIYIYIYIYTGLSILSFQKYNPAIWQLWNINVNKSDICSVEALPFYDMDAV